MKELLFSVCATSLFSSAVAFLCPKGNEGIGKSFKLLCSLCICACLIFPAVRLIKNDVSFSLSLPDVDEGTVEASFDAIIDGTVQNICSEMENYVSSYYGIKNPKLTLKIDKNNASQIRIIEGHLTGKGKINEAADYISGVLACKITCGEE